jgi:hypothetical protein
MHKLFYEKYEHFKDKRLKHRRFKQKDLYKILGKYSVKKELIGHSFEGREIIKLVIGTGQVPLLFWSQMHGNEATATMALLDLLNFFESKTADFESFKADLLSKFTLHIIPMLNPDGAERFIRRTAQNIDMNRDALSLACVESEILKNQVLSLKPLVSFNLHDQNTLYTVGSTFKQATISFLATAYNQTCDWNPNRTRAGQLISSMNSGLQDFIPGHVGRFSDEFEPRAFGDNVQLWGSSLILIESGGYNSDIEKQYIRKLNFVAILTALHSLLDNKYEANTLDEYHAIPQNSRNIFHFLIKNVQVKSADKTYKIDIGINFEEINNAAATKFKLKSVIEDIGDLSVFSGLKVFDAQGAILETQASKNQGILGLNLGDKATFALINHQRRIEVINGEILD